MPGTNLRYVTTLLRLGVCSFLFKCSLCKDWCQKSNVLNQKGGVWFSFFFFLSSFLAFFFLSFSFWGVESGKKLLPQGVFLHCSPSTLSVQQNDFNEQGSL